ncbi:MAG: 23S rRNA (adenine(2503)-C(2))-methyltransferase RlmN, partial [Clostridiales bacterium]|nr:23S rRNA (adenine(2503)-C(2))-methyltransferase RlmN [Clostridiales bacterium]
MMGERIDIKSMNLAELTEFVENLGEKKYRAKQIYEWLHLRHAADFPEMTNLSKNFRERLSNVAKITTLRQEEVQESKLDGTKKYLFSTADGNLIESVRMSYKHGISVCISSQAGCRMGCAFCASAIGGLARNLTASEMLDQVYQISEEGGERVSNVVVMGTGEPLDNFDSLIKFIEILTDENGLNISQRNVTVSTCGLIPQMKKLAEKKLQFTLAVSLHAPNQRIREKIMPIAKKYEIHDLIAACRQYFEATGRRVTFEYSLIAGVNDSAADAAELARLLRGLNCHVNLISVNPVRERGLASPTPSRVQDFLHALESSGIT